MKKFFTIVKKMKFRERSKKKNNIKKKKKISTAIAQSVAERQQ